MEPTLFEATIEPHHSLGARGRRWLMGFLSVALVVAAVAFAWLGAWPVVGFAGGELLLAILLFRWHLRRGERREVLVLTETRLSVRRMEPGGRERGFSLPTAWLSARIEPRPGRAAALIVRAQGGREEEIGALLGEGERRDLAAALAAALERLRSPVFTHDFPAAAGVHFSENPR